VVGLQVDYTTNVGFVNDVWDVCVALFFFIFFFFLDPCTPSDITYIADITYISSLFQISNKIPIVLSQFGTQLTHKNSRPFLSGFYL
jgi:hypothetical protein